ncbi:MAG: response regulator transcription factor [Acidimicrobiales bacterium]
MSAPTPARPAGGQGRVLIVEDDDEVRRAVEQGLNLLGFEARSVGDAEAALTLLGRPGSGPGGRPEVVVADVGLPGISGIELCRRLRAESVHLPILILSALDQVGDRVAGLQAGADDYLVKPFDLEELSLRLRALLRRAAAVAAPAETERVTVGARLWLDLDRRRATFDGRPLDLSRREFDLLAAFATNAGIVLSRIRLLELVWGYDFDADTNVVDVFVGYLRRKLESAGAAPRMIETVRGVGFVLREP